MSNPQTLTQELLLAVAKKLDLTAENCPEVKAMEQYLAGAAKAAAAKAAKKDKKKDNKKDNKKANKKGGDKKADEAAKKIKAAFKEGGKKGQDIAGLCDLGGVAHFHLAVDSPAGDVALLKECMKGMNVVVDEAAEERKGGAGNIAKALFTYNDKTVTFLVHVPASRKDAYPVKEWAATLNESIGGKIIEEYSLDDGEYALCQAEGSEEKQLFPIKMRDMAINIGFASLVKRQLVQDDDSDDEINFADECDIEW